LIFLISFSRKIAKRIRNRFIEQKLDHEILPLIATRHDRRRTSQYVQNLKQMFICIF
jgi:hypothetical protein